MNSKGEARKNAEQFAIGDNEIRKQATTQLERTLASFYGYAQFVTLGEVVRVATEENGFQGTLEDAAQLLSELSKVRVESGPSLEQSHVYASAYWDSASSNGG